MNDWLFTERKRNANKFAIEKIKWNVLFHYLSLFIVIVAAAAVWGAFVCIRMSYYCICHGIQFELETIEAAAWLYDRSSSPPLLTDKSNKKPKKVTRTCTVAMMMMMVLMISSAIMWMLHILSLSSHQWQTKWNRKKVEQKSTTSLGRFINPIKMINSMGVWLTIDILHLHLHLHFERWIDNIDSQTMPIHPHNGWQFLFSSFWRHCG